MSGYVKISRDFFQDEAFGRGSYSEREAFLWLIIEAAYHPREKRVGKVIVELRRGQAASSIRFMAVAWGWHRSSVARFLDRLKKRDMIETVTETGVTVITLCNYERYQSAGNGSETLVKREARQKRDSSETNLKKDKKEKKEEREDPPYVPPAQKPAADLAAPPALACEFDRVWPHYPRRVGVGQARKAWAKARRSASFEEIAAPLRKFISATNGTPIDKIPHFATWLNGERWKDDQSHAANRCRTSTEDLRNLAIISSTDDLTRLMGPQLRVISQ